MGLCIRCGKQRVVISSHEEKVDNATVIVTITECSDPDCQKIVAGTLRQEESRRLQMRRDHERRELQRKAQGVKNRVDLA